VIRQYRDQRLLKTRCQLYNDARQLVSQYELPAGAAQPVWTRDILYLGARQVGEADEHGVHLALVDPLGTPRSLLDAQGNLESRQKFLPFGETIDQNGSLISTKGFTNHEQTDFSGLIYMQGRFYLPQYHRFVSPDPGLDQHPEDPQSWNRYAYVQNDPISKFDPDGQEQVDIRFRAFIPQPDMLGFRGDNRGFSVDPTASSRVSVDLRIETDPAINYGNPMIGEPKVTVSPTHLNLGGLEKTAAGPLLPQVAVTQDKFGAVNVNIVENVRNPFVPVGKGIRSNINIALNQDASHAWVQGALSGSPSFEVNFTPSFGPTTNLPLREAPQGKVDFAIDLQQMYQIKSDIALGKWMP
jgi:RHS repeat-associated protein